MKNFTPFLLLLCVFNPGFSQFRAGDNVWIDEPYNGDLYVAGGTVDVNKPVNGDLVAAGGQLSVMDTVYQDLLIAGGQINISGPVLDDVRCAGGNIQVRDTVGDDLLVCGGTVYITRNSIINGDLVVFGGQINMDGQVNGNIRSYGGEINLNGTVDKNISLKGGTIAVNGAVNGSAEIAAEELTFGDGALIRGNLNYWSEDGEIDIPAGVVGGTATYDPGLSLDKEEGEWAGGAALLFFVLYLLAAFLLILVLDLLFGKQFTTASGILTTRVSENLGVGFLYLIGVPVAIVVLLASVIGIPIGLFLMFLYIFSLLFGYAVASLLFVHYFSRRREQSRSIFLTVLLALMVAVALQFISFIPFIGWLIGLLVLVLAYGTLINYYVKQRRAKAVTS